MLRMSNPSTKTAALHPTQVWVDNLPLDVVENIRKLTKGREPAIEQIYNPLPLLQLAVAVVGIGAGSVFALETGMENFRLAQWLGFAAIFVPGLLAFVAWFLWLSDQLRNPLYEGLYLARSHALLVKHGVLICLPRARIANLKPMVYRLRLGFVLDDGASFDFPILPKEMASVDGWWKRKEGDLEDWPGDVFLGWNPTRLPDFARSSGAAPHFVRHEVSKLPAQMRQALNDLIDGKRSGLRFPKGNPGKSFAWLAIGGALLTVVAILAHRGDFPNVAVYAISYGLAALVCYLGAAEIDYRFLHMLRPGVYVDSQHLFVVSAGEVVVISLRELRVVRESRNSSEDPLAKQVVLEVDGHELHVWVTDPDFTKILRGYQDVQVRHREACEGMLENRTDPWLEPSVDGGRPTENVRWWIGTRFQRAVAAFFLIAFFIGVADQTAGRTFGYWLQIRQCTERGRSHAACLETFRQGAPEWYRSRLERRVWDILHKRASLSDLIWFLRWPGAKDFRGAAEENLRELARMELSARDQENSGSPFREAWLSQIVQEGEWRIRVSVRDSASTWPKGPFDGTDPSLAVRAYDSILAQAVGELLSNQANLPDSLPIDVQMGFDSTRKLLVVQGMPLDSTGASGEGLRRWRVSLPDGRTLMDFALPVDAWQVSQLSLSPKESALVEYLRSAMRQKLSQRM